MRELLSLGAPRREAQETAGAGVRDVDGRRASREPRRVVEAHPRDDARHESPPLREGLDETGAAVEHEEIPARAERRPTGALNLPATLSGASERAEVLSVLVVSHDPGVSRVGDVEGAGLVDGDPHGPLQRLVPP